MIILSVYIFKFNEEIIRKFFFEKLNTLFIGSLHKKVSLSIGKIKKIQVVYEEIEFIVILLIINSNLS